MVEEQNAKLPAEIQVELALARTLLACDRTLLAWVRTSLALFGFGFTLAKFIHSYASSGALHGINPDTARNVGIVMIMLGFCGLIGGVLEHFKTVKELKLTKRLPLFSPASFMAIALCLIGLYLAYDIFVIAPQ